MRFSKTSIILWAVAGIFLLSFISGIATSEILGGIICLIISIVLAILGWIKRKFPSNESTPQNTNEQIRPNKNIYVFVTKSGKKCHYDPKCIGTNKSIKMDLIQAKNSGYTACDKCCYDYLHH